MTQFRDQEDHWQGLHLKQVDAKVAAADPRCKPKETLRKNGLLRLRLMLTTPDRRGTGTASDPLAEDLAKKKRTA